MLAVILAVIFVILVVIMELHNQDGHQMVK